MNRRFISAVVIVVALLGLARLGGGLDWYTSLPTLTALKDQLRFDLRTLKGVFELQNPSQDPFSITMLTIRAAREEASNLRAVTKK